MLFHAFANDGKDLGEIELLHKDRFGAVKGAQLHHLISALDDDSFELGHLSFVSETKRLNAVRVVGDYFYRTSTYPRGVDEYNPDMNIYSSSRCRWTYPEIEYKIDIANSTAEFYARFDELQIPGFSIGSVEITTSYERYKLLDTRTPPDRLTPYYVILHRNTSEEPNAIKFKIALPGTILTRQVTILDYDEENLDRAIKELNRTSGASRAAVIDLPPFSKEKKRFPVIDEDTGFIFGVSFSIAQTLTRERQELCQLEIEYWSCLLEQEEEAVPENLEKDRNSCHWRLIKRIRRELDFLGFQFEETQKTKLEWLLSI